MNGQLCPQVEHALQTGVGHAVWTSGMRLGAWKHAGMSGQPVGLDLDHVLARACRLAPLTPLERVERLALAFERGALAGMAEKHAASGTVSGPGGGADFDLDAYLDGASQ